MSTTAVGRVGDDATPLRAPEVGRRRVGASWWSDVWRRFRCQKLPLAAGVVLICLALLAILAPVVSPHDPAEQFRREGLSDLGQPLAPNAHFWFGTDNLGRDLLSRLLWGGRISLAIGVAASAIVMVMPCSLAASRGLPAPRPTLP